MNEVELVCGPAVRPTKRRTLHPYPNGWGSRVIVVGERGGKPIPGKVHVPLFPLPANCAGARLMKLSGYGVRDYVYGLDKRNLFPEFEHGRWDIEAAQEAAVRMWPTFNGCKVFLLGTKVWAAFEALIEGAGRWQLMSPTHLLRMGFAGNATIYGIPHPSGRCRVYNDESARAWVTERFKEVEPLLRTHRCTPAQQ